ncbi:MAG TPA: radical SAM protein [Patescibacteria group bacterium]|nr:radical SAM protein [Patescibacteria group bacterium]
MKITLISTSTYPSDQGIRTISSVLKREGHDVKIVFMTLSEDYSKNYSLQELAQLLSICRESKLIGINSFASTSQRASRIISFLKKNLNVPVVYGGVHATISPEDCINIADIICIGEGEGAITELADAIEKGKSFDKVKNLWIKNPETGKIIKNPVRNLIENLDSLPLPDYDIKEHYILEGGRLRKFREEDLSGQIFFLTGRGCPYGCDYCSNSFFNKLYEGKRKNILRWHSPEYIIEGILELKRKFPRTLGYFDIRDDTFSLRPLEDIKKFCKLYKEKIKMRFKCLADPHTVSDEKIKLLVDAGCTDIIVGIQGSEKTNLEIYHRNQKDEQVLKAAKILNKYKDLAVMYDVITCNPYESKENIIALINLLRKLPKPYFLSVNNLVFFPGSQLYRKAKQDKIIMKEKDSAYKLNYWDRAKHIKLKKKDFYLVLILNLMRGSVTDSRFGLMPSSLLSWLLSEKRIDKNLKNPFPTIFVLNFVELSDLVRERIIKPFYRSLPVDFKIWYDKIRYRV